MARSVSEIQREIQSLSAADQVELLRALIEGLDEGVDEDVERVWLEEAQRRHRELLNGTVTATPGEEVIAKARARLKNES